MCEERRSVPRSVLERVTTISPQWNFENIASKLRRFVWRFALLAPKHSINKLWRSNGNASERARTRLGWLLAIIRWRINAPVVDD
jgi:hypothetical protein